MVGYYRKFGSVRGSRGVLLSTSQTLLRPQLHSSLAGINQCCVSRGLSLNFAAEAWRTIQSCPEGRSFWR